MYLLTKNDDQLVIVASKDEKIRVGDICESDGVISQVVEIRFVDLPGILEHVIRQSLIPRVEVSEDTSDEIQTMFGNISDSKMIITKIRGHLEKDNGKDVFKKGLMEFDISREKTKPKLLPQKKFLDCLGLSFGENALAVTLSSEQPENFDFEPKKFGINLITGQKEAGKSYFCKRLLLKLIKLGVPTIVFDVNGEYQNLDKNESGEDNEFSGSIIFLDRKINTPIGNKQTFRIPLNEIRADEFAKSVNISEEQAMYTELLRFWNENRGKDFGLDELENKIKEVSNEKSRLALQGRIRYAKSLRLFGPLDWNEKIEKIRDGGAIIINLKEERSHHLSIMVRFIMKSIEKWLKDKPKGMSLFLEEAQNYVEKGDDMRDLLTRMRHIGFFPTFITNDPTTLPSEVLSLADNIISFKFDSDMDRNHLAKSGKIDNDTLKILKNLEKHQCLCIGKLTNDFPFFLRIKKQDGVKMDGETKPLV